MMWHFLIVWAFGSLDMVWLLLLQWLMRLCQIQSHVVMWVIRHTALAHGGFQRTEAISGQVHCYYTMFLLSCLTQTIVSGFCLPFSDSRVPLLFFPEGGRANGSCGLFKFRYFVFNLPLFSKEQKGEKKEKEETVAERSTVTFIVWLLILFLTVITMTIRTKVDVEVTRLNKNKNKSGHRSNKTKWKSPLWLSWHFFLLLYILVWLVQ